MSNTRARMHAYTYAHTKYILQVYQYYKTYYYNPNFGYNNKNIVIISFIIVIRFNICVKDRRRGNVDNDQPLTFWEMLTILHRFRFPPISSGAIV